MYQWTEAIWSNLFDVRRIARGGSWNGGSGYLSHDNWSGALPTTEYNEFGFRVATTVPEPSTAGLAVVACGLMVWRRMRFSLSWAQRACSHCAALMLFALLVGFATEARADVSHMAPGSFVSDR